MLHMKHIVFHFCEPLIGSLRAVKVPSPRIKGSNTILSLGKCCPYLPQMADIWI